MKIPERLHLYRVEDCLTRDGVMLCVSTYIVIKETKCGFWVSLKSSSHVLKECGGWLDWDEARKRKYVRWVRKNAERSHCYADFQKALGSYLKRKEMQELISRTSLETAELALAQRAEIMKLTMDDVSCARNQMVPLGDINSLYRYNFD